MHVQMFYFYPFASYPTWAYQPKAAAATGLALLLSSHQMADQDTRANEYQEYAADHFCPSSDPYA